MAYRRSRLLLCLSFCTFVLLAGCDGDQAETPPSTTEQSAPADTASSDVITMEESATPDTSSEPDAPSESDVEPAPSTGAAASTGELHADFEGTTEVVEGAPSGTSTGTLRGVRAARHADLDRIVFEFSGGVPAYRVGYVEGPVRRCGSGGLVDLPGEALLAVRLDPAEAFTMEGLLAVQNVSRITELPVIREHALVCDEQGQVSWVLGLDATSPYRAFTLSNPPRLVVDLRHGS